MDGFGEQAQRPHCAALERAKPTAFAKDVQQLIAPGTQAAMLLQRVRDAGHGDVQGLGSAWRVGNMDGLICNACERELRKAFGGPWRGPAGHAPGNGKRAGTSMGELLNSGRERFMPQTDRIGQRYKRAGFHPAIVRERGWETTPMWL